MLFCEFDGLVGCKPTEYEGLVPMKAYNLVLSRFFKASVSVTLYECPWHPYTESLPTLWLCLLLSLVQWTQPDESAQARSVRIRPCATVLDLLFSKEEQSNSLLCASKRSSKPGLDVSKVDLLFSKWCMEKWACFNCTVISSALIKPNKWTLKTYMLDTT